MKTKLFEAFTTCSCNKTETHTGFGKKNSHEEKKPLNLIPPRT